MTPWSTKTAIAQPLFLREPPILSRDRPIPRACLQGPETGRRIDPSASPGVWDNILLPSLPAPHSVNLRCPGTRPCVPSSSGAALRLGSKWWLTGLGFAVFLLKLSEERLNGKDSKRDGCTPPEVMSAHDQSRPQASLVKTTSQRGRVIELTGQSPSHGRQPWAMAGGRADGPLVSFSFKALCRVLSPR